MSSGGIGFTTGFSFTTQDVENAIKKMGPKARLRAEVALKNAFLEKRHKSAIDDILRGMYMVISTVGVKESWEILLRSMLKGEGEGEEKEVEGAGLQPTGTA